MMRFCLLYAKRPVFTGRRAHYCLSKVISEMHAEIRAHTGVHVVPCNSSLLPLLRLRSCCLRHALPTMLTSCT
jgi:hypothetical protein